MSPTSVSPTPSPSLVFRRLHRQASPTISPNDTPSVSNNFSDGVCHSVSPNATHASSPTTSGPSASPKACHDHQVRHRTCSPTTASPSSITAEHCLFLHNTAHVLLLLLLLLLLLSHRSACTFFKVQRAELQLQTQRRTLQRIAAWHSGAQSQSPHSDHGGLDSSQHGTAEHSDCLVLHRTAQCVRHIGAQDNAAETPLQMRAQRRLCSVVNIWSGNPVSAQ